LGGINLEKINFLWVIGLTSLFVLASFTNVIGTNASLRNSRSIVSPLFTLRAKQRLNKPVSDLINIDYVRKGETPAYYIGKPNISSLIKKLLNEKPWPFYHLLAKIKRNPKVLEALNGENIKINSLRRYLAGNTQILERLKQYLLPLIDKNIQPQSLSTSNPIGCIIVIIAMLPVLIVIATMTIVTCLVNGCLEQLFENFIQGLEPSD